MKPAAGAAATEVFVLPHMRIVVFNLSNVQHKTGCENKGVYSRASDACRTLFHHVWMFPRVWCWCRGVDMKLRSRSHGLLTLGPRMCKDTLMQAAMRMRQLELGQSLTLIATPEVCRCDHLLQHFCVNNRGTKPWLL